MDYTHGEPSFDSADNLNGSPPSRGESSRVSSLAAERMGTPPTSLTTGTPSSSVQDHGTISEIVAALRREVTATVLDMYETKKKVS